MIKKLFAGPARTLLGLVAVILADYASAEKQPLWELGLGIGGLHQSYYTGTHQTRSVLFPVILPVYRGDFFKSDDKGIRAEFFRDDRMKMDVSADFQFSVDSDDVDLRRGMPDIGNILQVGPSLEMTAVRQPNFHWYFAFPAKAAIEFDDGHVEKRGYQISPSIVVDQWFNDKAWRLGMSLSANYGSQAFNAIYYEVEPAYITSDRAAYKTASGYAGSRLQLAISSKTKRNLWVLFVRYDNISGAVFDDSSLVETNDNTTVGFLYSRYLLKSSRLVDRSDD